MKTSAQRPSHKKRSISIGVRYRTRGVPVVRKRPHKTHVLAFTVICAVVLGVATYATKQFDYGQAAGSIPAIGSAAAPSGYGLAWSDEFNGGGVDTNKWNVLNNSNYGASNNEDECYEPGNVAESGGQLHITGQRQTVTCGGTNPQTGNKTYYYTSGFLSTSTNGGARKFDFQYGYAEASIKMPKGNPYWGAFWLVGGNGAPAWPSYGEFDIAELLGMYPDLTYGTLVYGCSGASFCQTAPHIYNLRTQSAYGGSSNNGTQLTPSNYGSYTGLTSTQYVRYGFLWEPNRLTWYVNGRPVRSFDGTTLTSYTTNASGVITASSTEKTVGNGLTATSPAFSTMVSYRHSIDLNMAIGGNFPRYDGYTGTDTASGYSNGNLAADNPGTMDVDYVRVYQQSAAPTPPPPPPADTTKPTVSSSSLVANKTLSGTATIAATASDNVGITKVDLYVDGALVATDTTAPYSLAFDTTHYTNGNHSLGLLAYDAAGNAGASGTVTMVFKNTTSTGGGGSGGTSTPTPPPGGVTTTPTPGGPTTVITAGGSSSSKPVAVSGDIVVEPSTPDANVQIKLDGKTVQGNTIDTKQLTNGTHKLAITQNGATVVHTISVHNPALIQVRNVMRSHAVPILLVLLVVIGGLVWLSRRWALHLANKMPDGFTHFTGGSVVSPTKRF